MSADTVTSSTPPEVSIIIVNYNSSQKTLKCIENILNNTPHTIPYEVIVIDNASHSEDYNVLAEGIASLKETYKGLQPSPIRLVRLSRNYGYTGGNNVGAKIARGKYLVILNPDVVVVRGWLIPLLEVLSSSEEVAAVQGKILLPHGLIDSTGIFMDIYGNVVKRGYHEKDSGQYDNATFSEIFSVSGAAFAIKRDIFLKVGGFRSRYFMYFDEVDLCWRLRLLGYSVLYVPTSVVYHMHPSGIEERYDFHQRARFRYLDTKNKTYSILSNSCNLRNMLFLLLGLAGGILLDMIRMIKTKENRAGPRLVAVLHAILYNIRGITYDHRKYCSNKGKNKLNLLRLPLPVVIRLFRIKMRYGGAGFRKAYNKLLRYQYLFCAIDNNSVGT